MATPEERAVITDISDWLLDLYVKRDEACRGSDFETARSLQNEIEAVSEERRWVIEASE